VRVAEEERGNDRDLEPEKEPGLAWDEQKQALSNERPLESEQAPEQENERSQGQESWNEGEWDEPEQVKENEQAREHEDERSQGRES